MNKEALKSTNSQVFFSESDINYDDLKKVCSQKTLKKDYPLSESVINNVVVYDAKNFTSFIGNKEKEKELKTELFHALESGPGVFVIRNLYEHEVLDQSNRVFEKITQKEIGTSNDHFASGTNTRIWNSFQKVALEDPDAFISYY